MSCTKFLISIAVLIFLMVNQKTDPSDFDDFITRSKALGYVVEEHFIETEDGFVLSLHRLRGKPYPTGNYFKKSKKSTQKIHESDIFNNFKEQNKDLIQDYSEFHQEIAQTIAASQNKTHSQNITAQISHEKKKKMPILMGHGLGGSSDTFIRNIESKSLAYVLVNEGFDVFLVNNRGNLYSSRHMKFSRSQDEYWDFSFDEMAKYDLPAVVEYIIEGMYEGDARLNYIGHSQGCNVILAALADEYVSEKSFDNIMLITPAAIQKNVNSTIQNLMKKVDFLPFLRALGLQEFLRTNSMNYYLCKTFPALCTNVLNMVTDTKNSPVNHDMFYRLMYHYPAGTSTKAYIHFNQMIRSQKFQHYDYGEELNLIHYKSPNPPMYDLANVKGNIHMIAGSQDLATNLQDVYQLINELKGARNVTISVFAEGHCSFILGTDNSYQKKILEIITP